MSQAQGVSRFVRVPKSVLLGVTDAAWDTFVRAMSVRPIRDVSKAGGIGSFDLRPRRLGELGVMVNLRREGGVPGKWVGDLVHKYEGLATSGSMQYAIFAASMTQYDAEMGELPAGVSRSGALAILHCGGTGALRAWPEGAFKTTREVFNRVNNLF